MTTKPATSFSKSFGTAHSVTLTDSSGNIMTAVADSPNIYKKAVTGAVTTDFYLGYDGSEEPLPVGVVILPTVQHGVHMEQRTWRSMYTGQQFPGINANQFALANIGNSAAWEIVK